MKLNEIDKIFILAGETSGDYIGSCIMRGIKQNNNNIKFLGVGGSFMENEGLSSLYNIKEFNVIGFLNTVVKLKKLRNYVNEIVKFIVKEQPKIVITIDTKGFSLALAKSLKIAFKNSNYKCPLIHFVPPTIWAYGKSRLKKWKNIHDELICLYKIEEDIFKKYDTKCMYLGNPIIEKFLDFEQSKKIKNNYNNCSKKNNILLLPGSRNSEIKYVLPEFIKLIKNTNNKFKNVNWIIPITKSQYSNVLSKVNEIKSYPIEVIILEDNYEILKHASVAIACSGTITLELVLFKIPTIAVYKTDFISALIGRMLVNFKNVILPNFLLKENAVPFLFQEKCNYIQMQKALINFMNNIEIQNKMYKNYSKNILKDMGYLNSKSTNFTINSGEMVINLINNYKR
jgi:lipid-A-disaccharide synthase